MHAAKYRNAARTCDVIFADSRYTADDVVERLGVAPERLRVAYPGVGEVFTAEGEAADLGRPYLLAVATLEPRKNVETLLAAHKLLDGEPTLAVVGASGWGKQPDMPRDAVLRLGYVPDEELPRLYRGAAAFVFPSRFEGFGIPVIEAMASGVPCVVSSHPSLDEASGDAAIRVDPDDREAIAAGIREALDRRDELVGRGRAHAARFTWDDTGRSILSGYGDFL